MNQPFEQRELPASEKDFAISQYEEFVKKLEESLKIETCEIAITYLEPSPSPEVDSILNTLLRLNARLMNVRNLIESTESVDVDEILKEKDEEIQTLQDKVDELETTVTDKEAEIESLKASNTKKK